MSVGLNFRPSVLAAKDYLAQGREKAQQQHLAGSPGIQVCARLTDVLDTAVLGLYESALEDLEPEEAKQLRDNVALVPNGGYGRRDVAPYSDVDLLILHDRGVAASVAKLARRLMHDLYDVGLQLGHSVRTPREACQAAMKEATIFTSLAESRFLVGSQALYDRFAHKFQQRAQRNWRRLIKPIEAARADERTQFGETVHLLEPNVKKSRGGLRDIQLLRWIGFARYGHADLDGLQLIGALSRDDYRDLRHAMEFLLRLRNEMHFHVGKPIDVLGRAEQVRIAALFGYSGTESLLPVEQFMRDYFQHSDQVSQTVNRFAANARPWRKLADSLAPLFTHQVERDFRVGPARIGLTPRGEEKLRGNLTQVLRLCDLANLYNKSISAAAWQVIHNSASKIPATLSVPAAERFLAVLTQPMRLGEILRGLHECRVLEKIIPDFAHARCLLQFNEYHKYTVDEHCIRAVEAACEMRFAEGPLGDVYRELRPKRTLHLALLIHDLGKGYIEDHSEVGLRIADVVGQRLRLPTSEAETLKFLVHKHLAMSHLAFRRDTSDSQLIVRFAVEVGSPEVLQMLFLLSAADLAAVGPGVLNEWKIEVLADLYQRTMKHLAGDTQSINSQERRAAVRACLVDDEDDSWYVQHVEALPSSYLFASAPDKIADDLRHLRTLRHGEVISWARWLPESQTVEYTVGTFEDITPGLFHKLTGALTSQGLQILSADINTLADGLVLDRFVVHDPDYAGEPSPLRLSEVRERLSSSLTRTDPPAFRRVWQSGQQKTQVALATRPTVVKADNSFSDRYTIIDVFTSDRMGLLYTITRTLFEMGLSVSLAKIGTHLDQVVDVFYVTDQSGEKIEDETRLQEIREQLLAALDAMEPA